MVISDDLRRVLLEGPSGPDDYETARYLIEQGLADGRYGPPSKSRDHYGKITQLVWFGITPAGRLWLEQLEHQREQALVESGHDEVTQQTKRGKIELRAQKPQSPLVHQAWVVLGGLVLLLLAYLLKTHFGISS